MSLMNITRPPINPSNYDLQAVVLHEIDEALEHLPALEGAPTPTRGSVPLFLTGGSQLTTAGDSANFSINGGTTMLVKYNQNNSGDYGDWWSIGAHTPRVQDAFATPGALPNLKSN